MESSRCLFFVLCCETLGKLNAIFMGSVGVGNLSAMTRFKFLITRAILAQIDANNNLKAH